MKAEEVAIAPGADFEAIQSELLLNLIAVVKIQQLNIDLLWQAIGSGTASSPAIAKMRESSDSLADCMQKVCGFISGNARRVN